MADLVLFTFDNGLALTRGTLEPSANVDGILRDVDGTEVQTYDLNGLPATVRTNARGYYGGYKAPIRVGLLDFGDVPLPVSSLEARDAGLYVADAVLEAAAAREAADAAARTANEARAAVALKVDRAEVEELGGRVSALEGAPVVSVPVASFTHTVSGLTVNVDATSSTAATGRTVAEFWWDFGDGPVKSATAKTSHTFTTAGTRSVTLFVLDSAGAQSATVSRAVTTVAPPNVGPTASFTSTATNLAVTVDGSGSTDPDGTIASYAWVFGDGTSGTGQTATHTYAQAGSYTVALTVTDDDGAKHYATRTVTVAAAAPPAPVYVFVQSATVSTQQTALASAIETILGRAIDQRLADTDPTLGTALAASNVIGIIADGTAAANIAANAPNLATTANPVIYFNAAVAAAHNLGARSDLVSGDAWTSAYLPTTAVGKAYAAGKASGSYAYVNSAQATPAFTVAGLGAGAEVVLYHTADTATQRVISMAYEKGAALAGGAAAAGRRAFGNWRNANPAGVFTQNARDFVGGLLAWARSAATVQTGVAAPVLTSATQTTTTTTGGVVTTVYECRADADLLLFEVSSFATNGGLPYATLAADGTTTRTRVSAELPAGRREYWAKQKVGAVTSPESNHRTITVASAAPAAPAGDVSLTPFMNQAKIRFEMADGSQGAIVPPVWYLGQPTSGVIYEPEDSPATLDVRRTDTPLKMNQGQYGHGIRYASLSDPLTTVNDSKDSGRSLTGASRVHIPVDQVAAVGNDGHSHVVQPPDENGVTYIVEMIGFSRVDETTVSATRVHKIRMDGHGLGPAAGVRAYGGAATAGLIRAWEIDPTHPSYTGRIDHVLAVAMAWRQLKSMWVRDAAVLPSIERWNYYNNGATDQTMQPGWPTGMRRAGPTTQPNTEGYLKREMPFPVTEEDYSGPSDYFGNVIYGSLLVIPPSVTAASLGITRPESLMVFNALQNYGAMVVDCVGGDTSMPLYIEHDAPSAWRTAISTSSFTYPDLQKMKANLRVVANSRDYTTPNGGPLGVARRGQAVPGFQ